MLMIIKIRKRKKSFIIKKIIKNLKFSEFNLKFSKNKLKVNEIKKIIIF